MAASSPDLNPLDYAIWSILEDEVNAEAHNFVEALKQAIEDAFNNLDQEMINQAIGNWLRQLDTVIKAKANKEYRIFFNSTACRSIF
jgi:hypothetical protein